jgi:AcrR family transcriptional regulator
MTKTLSRRERTRLATIGEIKDTARRQIAEEGAASLSLGAIARSMGMTTPALYRYFDNRDALVNALILDAYESMADALEAAGEELPAADYEGRYLAIARAYRRWARDNAQLNALMFGGHADNTEITAALIGEAMARSLLVMVRLLTDADEAGRLTIPEPYRGPPPTVAQALNWLRSALPDPQPPTGILALSYITWLRAHALVWQELHGPLPNFLFSSGELFEMEMGLLAQSLEMGEYKESLNLLRRTE